MLAYELGARSDHSQSMSLSATAQGRSFHSKPSGLARNGNLLPQDGEQRVRIGPGEVGQRSSCVRPDVHLSPFKGRVSDWGKQPFSSICS